LMHLFPLTVSRHFGRLADGRRRVQNFGFDAVERENLRQVVRAPPGHDRRTAHQQTQQHG
jgi:hypothetical protein